MSQNSLEIWKQCRLAQNIAKQPKATYQLTMSNEKIKGCASRATLKGSRKGCCLDPKWGWRWSTSMLLRFHLDHVEEQNQKRSLLYKKGTFLFFWSRPFFLGTFDPTGILKIFENIRNVERICPSLLSSCHISLWCLTCLIRRSEWRELRKFSECHVENHQVL